MRNPLASIYRWFVFKSGDTRWIGWKSFPFVATWDVVNPGVKGPEVQTALRVVKKGDVLVLRHDGFLSNLGIGGAMVHAALCVGDDHVIEALSDDEGGIVRRHLSDTLQCDKAILLRPSVLSEEVIDLAALTAHTLLGFHYDIFFEFNSEAERELIKADYAKAKAGAVKFCCTEIPHYCYLDQVDKLHLYRKKNPNIFSKFLCLFGLGSGDTIITADMYMEANFDIVWASKGATVDWFRACKAEEKLVRRVEQYHEKVAREIQ